MNRHILIAGILMCLTAIVFSQTSSIQVAGVKRSYILHAPSGLNNPALVFLLHGLGGDGAGMQSTTQMDKVADREKFIATYPSAVGGTWDYASTKNDYKFLLALIDTIDAKYHIDRNRVYVTGFSQGGGMTVYAGFEYPDIFAAIAPVSSVGSGATTPKRPIPIFLTFGTKDLYTPATFMTSVSSWLKIDGCQSTPVVTRPYPSTNTKSVVTRLDYGTCEQGTGIVVDSISGGPHEWPMNTATKVNNSEEVWAFFKRFSLAGNTSVPKPAAALTHDKFSVSLSSGIIHIQGIQQKNRICVTDIKGRLINTVITDKNQFSFNSLYSGLYIVTIKDENGFNAQRILIP